MISCTLTKAENGYVAEFYAPTGVTKTIIGTTLAEVFKIMLLEFEDRAPTGTVQYGDVEVINTKPLPPPEEEEIKE